jgi:hypothetical protein
MDLPWMFGSLIVIVAVAIIITYYHICNWMETKVWLRACVLRGLNFAGILFYFLGLSAGNRFVELTEYRDNTLSTALRLAQVFDDPLARRMHLLGQSIRIRSNRRVAEQPFIVPGRLFHYFL